MKKLHFGFLFCGVLLCSIYANAASVTVSWDKNLASDLAGYKVLYSTGQNPPYENIKDFPLAEITDPENPSVTIDGFAEQISYFFVVLAYDTEGLEGEYSDEVGITMPNCPPGKTCNVNIDISGSCNITINCEK